MYLTLLLIFNLLFFASCGQHTQNGSGTQGVSNYQVIRTDTLLTDILNEDLSSLKDYISKGGDINFELENGRTILTEACQWRKFKVIAFLIENKVDIDKKDRTGKNALEYGEEDIKIKYVLFPQLVIDLQRNLFLAAKANDFTGVKKILEEMPPINFLILAKFFGDDAADFEGETFLTFSVKSKLENVLRLLAQPKYELDVNVKNSSGQTPLQIAKDLNFKNIEKLLLKLGALE